MTLLHPCSELQTGPGNRSLAIHPGSCCPQQFVLATLIEPQPHPTWDGRDVNGTDMWGVRMEGGRYGAPDEDGVARERDKEGDG